jgi:hypothetical protein
MLKRKLPVLFCAAVILVACDNHPPVAKATPPVSANGAQPDPADPYAADRTKLIFSSYCTSDSSPDESLSYVTRALSYLSINVPSVPPEETAYLERGSKAVSEISQQEYSAKGDHTASNRRWNTLLNRRLYYAWQAHKGLADAAKLIDNVDSNSDPPWDPYGSVEANRMYRMLNAVRAVDEAAVSVQKFLDHEAYRTDSLLTQAQYDGISMSANLNLSYNLQRAMQCQFAHLMLDKK